MTLQKIRRGTAWLVIGLFLWVFVGGEQVSSLLLSTAPLFQFTPSLARFLLTAGTITAVGFLVILGLTLLFGRVYCASFCPLGILQDVVGFGLRARKKKLPAQSYQRPSNLLRYGILGLTLAASVSGMLSVLNLLDPYSLFGRIAAHLFKPVFVFLNNLAASALELFDIYAVTTQAYHQIPLLIAGSSLALCGLLIFLTSLRGRMYCNTICPVGTLLGLVSHLSLYKIRLRRESCVSCGICETACRGGCIESRRKFVDSSRCVACFDCLTVCPKAAVEYAPALNIFQRQPVDPSRRKLLFGSTLALGSLALLSTPLRSFSRQLIPKSASLPISPPGSISLEHFTGRCTACHLCVSACPSKVIQPTWFEYGLQGMFQPALDYAHGSCAYQCNVCGGICPTGAITPLSLAAKKRVQIGKAQLVKDDCLVHVNDQECGACAEVCPTHAVYTEEKHGILYPEMDVALCIGCGACQYVCPQMPKAIFVEANRIHDIAQEPFYNEEDSVAETPEAQPESTEDFPF